MIQMDVDIFKIRIFASIAIVLIWMQLIFWCRISDYLAAFVELIIATMEDIIGFVLILVCFLMMFASAFYMLQINRLTRGNEIDLFEDEDNLYNR